MQTTTNNTEKNAVSMQTTENPAPQQIVHVKTFKIFGCIQIGFGAILVILSLVELIGMAFDIVVTLPLIICSGWFVMTGCLPLTMSKNIESSFRCKKIGFMVCSIIGAALFSPIIFSFTLTAGDAQTPHEYRTWHLLTYSITFLSACVAIVAVISASYCCCFSPWGSESQQFVVVMSPLQLGMNVNGSGNQIQTTNIPPVMDTTGKTVLHSKAHQYNFVGGTDQGLGYPQNQNISNSYSQLYI